MGHFHRGFINSGVFFDLVQFRGWLNNGAFLNEIGYKYYFEVEISEGDLLIPVFFVKP